MWKWVEKLLGREKRESDSFMASLQAAREMRSVLEDIHDIQASARAEGADEETIQRLVAQFDESYDAGGEASATLVKVGEPAVPFLIEAVKEREGYRFAWGSLTLERMGRKASAAIPVLQEIADDPTRKENHRREARETIVKIRGG